MSSLSGTTSFDGLASQSGSDRLSEPDRSTAIDSVRPPQLHALTSIRALFALMVVFHHFVGYHGLSAPGWTGDIGNIAVGWFFMLSGFILAYNFPTLPDRNTTLKFVVSRFWRLFPVHLVMLVVSIALFADSRSLVRNYPIFFLQSLTLTHAWDANPSATQAFNVPAWSISVEWFFYLMFPLLIARGWITRALLAAMAFAAAAAWASSLDCFSSVANFHASRGQFQATCHELLLYWPPARLWEFTLGIALCGLSTRMKKWDRSSGIVQVAILLLSVAVFFDRWELIGKFQYGFGSFLFVPWVVTSFVGAAVILALSLTGLVSRALSFTPLIFLGEISFSVYMTHMLILRFTDDHHIGYTLPIAIQFIGIYAAATVASACLFLYIERPSRLMLKNFFRQRMKNSADALA